MKINKKTLAGIGLIAAMGISFNACKKDSSVTTSATVTEADAVEMTTDALVPGTAGMSTQLSASVNIYKTASLNCGIVKDTTITWATQSGVTPSYNALLSWSYTLDCENAVPNTLVFNFSGNSNYSGVKMALNGTTSGNFTLGSLQPSQTAYSLSSSYTRSGNTTSKIGSQHTYTSKVMITSSNIAVDKVTGQILSGTGIVSITGNSSTGSSFSFGGNITFNGNDNVNLVLNSGTQYTITW